MITIIYGYFCLVSDVSQYFFNQNFHSENQWVQDDLLHEKEISLCIKREDQIHPEVSGNKFRKLKYNLLEAKKKGFLGVLTFGGAYSNHILATAVAARMMGLESVGIIRGEELKENLKATLEANKTLGKAVENGMKLDFISRSAYREKDDTKFLKALKGKFGNFYLIPEGGTNDLAVSGCEEILTEEDAQFDYICTCVGTGGTIAGLINASGNHQKVFGFPALKGDFLVNEVSRYVGRKSNWRLVTDYHFGGYAKYNLDLIRFINDFNKNFKIPLDPIYTGKMLYGIFDMINKDVFEKGSQILVIHTGGLQGVDGFNRRLERKQEEIRIE